MTLLDKVLFWAFNQALEVELAAFPLQETPTQLVAQPHFHSHLTKTLPTPAQLRFLTTDLTQDLQVLLAFGQGCEATCTLESHSVTFAAATSVRDLQEFYTFVQVQRQKHACWGL